MNLPKRHKAFVMVAFCVYSVVLFNTYKLIQQQTFKVPIRQEYFGDRYFGDVLGRQKLLKRFQPKPLQIANPPPCKGKQNFVFIKCMKCATETMATVLRRFGITRNLSFVLPVRNHLYLGWPYLMEKYDYRPPLRRSSCANCSTGYNILMEHAIYNRSIMQSIMPADTVYISIIREPYNHFLSVFHYFEIKKFVFINKTDYISEYLNNYNKYETIYKNKTFNEHYCIPQNFSLTENLMSHCLGIPLGFPEGRSSIRSYSDDEIKRYLHELDNDFLLVMIVEYFDESLVLLRRLMCWEMKDVIFHKSNVGGYRQSRMSNNTQTERNKKLHKSYSRIDYILYDYFNRTLWKKIDQQTQDFFDEVKYFREVQTKVANFCEDLLPKQPTKQFISIKKSLWNRAFNVTNNDCKLMYSYLLTVIQNLYDKETAEQKDVIPNPNRKIC